jgi:hypothetical protein
MKNPCCFGKRGTRIAFSLIVTIIASLFLIQAQEERKDESSIFLVDCSQSMVAGIHKDMESKELMKSYTSGHNLLFSLPPYNLDRYLKDPANKGVISDSMMFKACEALEKMIEDYTRGPVEIITFHEGPVDLDRGGPFAKVFSGNIDPGKPESKKRILQFINPVKYGKAENAPLWNGILWETLKKGGGPTRINTSCKYAMNMFNKKLKKPGFREKLMYQRLVVFTDGREMEKKSDFNKVQSLYKLEPMDNWYEYREDYVVVKKEEPKEAPAAVTRKAKISITADSLKGSLKEDGLAAPAFKGDVALAPALKVMVAGEGDFTPRGSISIALSQEAKDVPAPVISPSSIEKKDFGKDVAFKLSYTGIKPFFETLSQEKEVKCRLSLEYKPAVGEDIKKEDIPRLSIPVSVKMIPGEKLISIVPQAGFEAKPAPDGVTWEMPDEKNIQGQYAFSVDFSRAPQDAKLEVELQEDPQNKGLSVNKGSEIGKISLSPDANKKASFDIVIDLNRTEEKLTGVMTAKATPSQVKAIPPKIYFSIANPIKVFKVIWKNQQKQDVAAPQAIDYGKIKIKKIKTGDYQKPSAHGFAIQPELDVFSSINTPVNVSLEGTIIAVMGLKIEGEGKVETIVGDCPPNKIIAPAFRENLKPGKYSGTLIIKTALDRVEIQPSGKAGIPIQIEIAGPGYLWLIIITIVLLLFILLFALKGRKEEEKPKAPQPPKVEQAS